MPVVNIPIKILADNHSHSRRNSQSSVDNDQPNHQQSQQQQPPSSNMFPNGFPSNMRSRSPMDFPNFQSSTSAFDNDPDWMNFSSFPNFPSSNDFPSFARDRGGLSPNPMMSSFRRSPTPTSNTGSPSSTLRRNSNHSQRASPPQQQSANHGNPSSAPRQNVQAQNNSRPPSRANREAKEVEVPERPAVIPLPYEKPKEAKKEIEESVARISLGKDNCEACPKEKDNVPSPLTSPMTEGKPKRGKKLQRNQSVVDFNNKTIVALDKIEAQVEQLRKKAAEMEVEKDQILRSLGEITVHNCLFKLADCDREEIEAITDRLTKRTKTVQVVVETPRNEEQKKALESATHMIDEASNLMKSNVEKAKQCIQTYLNACSSEETVGATCQNFLKVTIQCAADDQKRIKRRLENLMSQIENGEKATADLMDDESE